MADHGNEQTPPYGTGEPVPDNPPSQVNLLNGESKVYTSYFTWCFLSEVNTQARLNAKSVLPTVLIIKYLNFLSPVLGK